MKTSIWVTWNLLWNINKCLFTICEKNIPAKGMIKKECVVESKQIK